MANNIDNDAAACQTSVKQAALTFECSTFCKPVNRASSIDQVKAERIINEMNQSRLSRLWGMIFDYRREISD